MANDPSMTNTPTPAAAPRSRYRYAPAPAVAAGSATAEPIAPRSPLQSLLHALGLKSTGAVVAFVLFLTAFYFLFQANIMGLLHVFRNEAAWSHGFIVPALGLLLIFFRRHELENLTPKPAYIGLFLIIVGVVSQILFRSTGLEPMSNVAMTTLLFGVVLFVLGWQYMKVMWLPICYLIFMMPPPPVLYERLTIPMQNIAATLGVKMLPIFGIEAIQSGTVMKVKASSGQFETLNVAEACSGMRMLISFFALAVVLAYSTSRPMWQKFFMGCCALPIAILCNAFRVTITGALVAWGGQQWAHGATHEFVGLFMLIPAVFMLLGIAWLLDKIFLEVDDEPQSTAKPQEQP